MKRVKSDGAVRYRVIVLPGGKLPIRARSNDVGYDIPTRAIVSLDPDPRNPRMRTTLFDFDERPTNKRIKKRVKGDEFILRRGETVFLGTGVVLKIPPGVAAYVEPRGFAKRKGLRVINSDHPIDPGFRGEPVIEIKLTKRGKKKFRIGRFQRLAQVGFKEVKLPEFEVVSSLPDTVRGNGSHGSTGVDTPEANSEPARSKNSRGSTGGT